MPVKSSPVLGRRNSTRPAERAPRGYLGREVRIGESLRFVKRNSLGTGSQMAAPFLAPTLKMSHTDTCSSRPQ